MPDLAGLLADLAAESADLDARVGPLPEAHWARLTPADGWTIAHQIAHLAWTDHMATLAATDPEAFHASLATAADDPFHFVDRGTETFLGPPAELLDRWRAGRAALAEALAAAPSKAKLPWYASAMSPASMVTARIMEPGRTARTSRTRSATAAPRPTGCDTSRTWAFAPSGTAS